jgi:hypothetical protein
MSIINNTDLNVWRLLKLYEAELDTIKSDKIGVIIFSTCRCIVYDQDSKLMLDVNEL